MMERLLNAILKLTDDIKVLTAENATLKQKVGGFEGRVDTLEKTEEAKHTRLSGYVQKGIEAAISGGIGYLIGTSLHSGGPFHH